MKYKRLSDFADFRTERTANITFENYISTENMIRDKGGIMTVSSLPDAKTTSAYKTGDILLSNIRPYFKKIWFATQSGSCSNDVLVLKTKKNILPLFLYYVLSDDNFFNYDTITSKGTKMPRGTPHAIMKYLVPDIQVDKQTKIASILSAYDDLIENNNKRIKILEQMAENLYKEWFVRFRFPGYETAEFENGIPKGWEIRRLDKVSKLSAGGDAPKDFSLVQSKEYPTPIYSNGIVNDGLYGYCKKPTRTAKSITISARGTVGFVCLRFQPYMPIVRLVSIEPKNESVDVFYLYYYFKENSIEGYGTSQQQITIPYLSKKKILIPSIKLIEKFGIYTAKLFDKINVLKEKNQNLIKQRDLLLPRLMSGKLEVEM